MTHTIPESTKQFLEACGMTTLAHQRQMGRMEGRNAGRKRGPSDFISPTPESCAFGARMRAARKARGYVNVAALGAVVRIGRGKLQSIEAGHCRIGCEDVQAVCRALGITVEAS
jgi:hypothetical protein